MTITNSPNTNTIVDPQLAYIDQLLLEGKHLTGSERADHEAMVAELAGELATAERVQEQALGNGSVDITQTESELAADNKKLVKIKLAKGNISWIPEDAEVEVSEVKTDSGNTFLWGDITSLHRVTAKAQPPEQLKKKLVPVIQSHIGSFIDLRRSSNLRKEPDIVSEMHAFKDNNLRGHQNRAILLSQKFGNREMFLLAALFNHNSQSSVMNLMMRRRYGA